MRATSDLDTILSNMHPVLHSGRYAFVRLPPDATLDLSSVVASIREAEGLSVVLPEKVALDHGYPVAFTAAWITLTVQSDLAAVGLTAAFSRVLTQASVSCNVVAGVHHDHVFVPFEQAQRAMEVLHALQQSVAAR
jgi:hypothetical protein